MAKAIEQLASGLVIGHTLLGRHGQGRDEFDDEDPPTPAATASAAALRSESRLCCTHRAWT